MNNFQDFAALMKLRFDPTMISALHFLILWNAVLQTVPKYYSFDRPKSLLTAFETCKYITDALRAKTTWEGTPTSLILSRDISQMCIAFDNQQAKGNVIQMQMGHVTSRWFGYEKVIPKEQVSSFRECISFCTATAHSC